MAACGRSRPCRRSKIHHPRPPGAQRDRAVGRCRVPAGRRRRRSAPAADQGRPSHGAGSRLELGVPAAAPADGRVFFVIPWLGKTLIGTTDTITDEGPDALTVSSEDIHYLLEAWHHYFPGDSDSPVLGTFVGLRPLIRAQPHEPSARSREFRIFESKCGLVSVAGGKFTTFRAMAEEITDRLGRRLGKRGKCRTRRLRLHGARPQPGRSSLLRRIGIVTIICPGAGCGSIRCSRCKQTGWKD